MSKKLISAQKGAGQPASLKYKVHTGESMFGGSSPKQWVWSNSHHCTEPNNCQIDSNPLATLTV